MSWTPVSWRDRTAAQMPVYPDAAALARAEARLASAAALTANPCSVSNRTPARYVAEALERGTSRSRRPANRD